jgi:hypothetical protein
MWQQGSRDDRLVAVAGLQARPRNDENPSVSLRRLIDLARRCLHQLHLSMRRCHHLRQNTVLLLELLRDGGDWHTPSQISELVAHPLLLHMRQKMIIDTTIALFVTSAALLDN